MSDAQVQPVGDPAPSGGSPGVGRVFLWLGLTSFGGPVAHLGFFRTEFVDRRRWLGERQFADLVALAQFLPGPASSQVGMGVGLLRGGIGASLRAWLGFTLPTAFVLIVAGLTVGAGLDLPSGLVAGLKVAAVAVVAHALLQMARALCRGWLRTLVALASGAAILAVSAVWTPALVLVVAALVGLALIRDVGGATPGEEVLGVPSLARWLPGAAIVLFALLLVGLPVVARIWPSEGLVLIAGFYRAGALVFGGGHVVLPMLEQIVVGSGAVSGQEFVAGYGLANAMPGPLFAFAGYLGAIAGGPVLGVLAVVAIFLPGFLLVVGVLGHWHHIAGNLRVRRGLAAVNAAVVGLLGAALYDPVWVSAITGWGELALAAGAFIALLRLQSAPQVVVLACSLAGWLLLGG